ncbi:MAG: RNA recognition motif domain-containing protein [Neisseriaceae bacterium]
MKKALFVAGLDFAITDDNLKEIFSNHGTVESAKVATDRYSGQSRGFGFVEMSSQEEAQNCISNLNNTTVKNRQIVVKIKENKADSSNQRRSFSNRW